MLYIDLDSNTLWAGRKSIKVFPMEAEFLYIMIDNIGRVITYERIAIALWGQHVDGPADLHNSVNGYIFKVREHFKKLEISATLENYYNKGVRLVLDEVDPDDEYIARCMKHRRAIEEFLKGQNRVRTRR